jgi:hypothetical protein
MPEKNIQIFTGVQYHQDAFNSILITINDNGKTIERTIN